VVSEGVCDIENGGARVIFFLPETNPPREIRDLFLRGNGVLGYGIRCTNSVSVSLVYSSQVHFGEWKYLSLP